ncbi:MAG: hypothetical protein C4525_02960 [Desulfarculus sp.]|jgi:hypothetical protein|nr:MAG: hypothetical protein C4525_02960 [Desulfarculus sp.]
MFWVAAAGAAMLLVACSPGDDKPPLAYKIIEQFDLPPYKWQIDVQVETPPGNAINQAPLDRLADYIATQKKNKVGAVERWWVRFFLPNSGKQGSFALVHWEKGRREFQWVPMNYPPGFFGPADPPLPYEITKSKVEPGQWWQVEVVIPRPSAGKPDEKLLEQFFEYLRLRLEGKDGRAKCWILALYFKGEEKGNPYFYSMYDSDCGFLARFKVSRYPADYSGPREPPTPYRLKSLRVVRGSTWSASIVPARPRDHVLRESLLLDFVGFARGHAAIMAGKVKSWSVGFSFPGRLSFFEVKMRDGKTEKRWNKFNVPAVFKIQKAAQ